MVFCQNISKHIEPNQTSLYWSDAAYPDGLKVREHMS